MINLIIPTLNHLQILSLLIIMVSVTISLIHIVKDSLKRTKLIKHGIIFFHLTAFLSLLVLIINPQFNSDNKMTVNLITGEPTGRVLLPETNNHFDESIYKLSPTYYLNNSSTDFLFNKNNDGVFLDKIKAVESVESAEQVFLKHPSASQLNIIGDGLTFDQWKNTPNIKINYYPSKKLNGIIEPRWQQSIGLGEALVFSGRLQVTEKGIYRVELVDPAGQIASQKRLRESEPFSLMARPKLVGKHQYQIRVYLSEQLIKQESFWVEVVNRHNVRLLILQSSPSFETKQLQNWIGDQGGQVLILTQISKNKIISQSINQLPKQFSKKSLSQLDQSLFSQFDLIVINGKRLIAMSSKQLDDLSVSVANGLGLLVLIDEDLLKQRHGKSPNILEDFSFLALNQSIQVNPQLIKDDLSRQMITEQTFPLSAQPIIFKNEHRNIFRRLVENSTGEPIIASKNKQLGKVAVSLMKQSYQLVTSGEKIQYSQLWQHLIKNISRQSQEPFFYIKPLQSLLIENQLTKLCYVDGLTGNKAKKKVLVKKQSNKKEIHYIRLQADWFVSSRYCGYFWPKSFGWYQVIVDEDNQPKNLSNNFYIGSEKSWLAQQQAEKVTATLTKQANYAKYSKNQGQGKRQRQTKGELKRINSWIFWWLFFMSASFIWLEQKFIASLKRTKGG